jgi:hypothetical protein
MNSAHLGWFGTSEKAMGLRNFRDSKGAEWRVWDVVPHVAWPGERRRHNRRTGLAGSYTGPERRVSRDRRVRTPGLLTPGLESGWLCFETESDKRRLTPVPTGWDLVPDAELEGLLARARPVTRRRG